MPKVTDKKYRVQKYRKEWEKESWAIGWLSMGKNGEKAHCSLCRKDLAPGKSELIGHTKSALHIQFSKSVQGNPMMTTFVSSKDFTRIKAELNTVALVVRKNISFNSLDEFIAMMHFIADDSKAVSSMSCNRTKGTYLLTECLAVAAHEDLLEEIKTAKGISILCDKATDITMNKLFCVNVRFLNSSSEPVTRLYRLIPVEDGKADGLFESLRKALDEDDIKWEKIIGYASDGENLMQGANNSFLTRMRSVVPDVFVLKCFCHSFHLVAGHACEVLSKTAEQLIHDIYNYFKMSPNRQKSFTEFQHYVECEPHKILMPCQTRWLSISQCVNRIIEQWPALELYFTGEALEKRSPQAERIVGALKSPYIKATLEFSSYVLGDLVGLNTLFQSDGFKLHRLLPEVERVIRMYCQNFMVNAPGHVSNIDVDDASKWLATEKIYPGILASETVKSMKPHERESFLTRCREWFRVAVKQILLRIDVSDPLLEAFKDVSHVAILKKTAALNSAAVMFRKFSRVLPGCNVQVIDRQWRSLLVDEDVKKGGWENKTITEFWRAMKAVESYEELATFMLEITALPQSTAAVERTFSKINNCKTKLRNLLAVRTMEAIVTVSERFPANFSVSARLAQLHSKARATYMQKYLETERSRVELDDINSLI